MKEAAIWVHVSKLAPWDKNPRRNDGAVESVAASIREFGFAAPIVAWKEKQRIVAGHTRIKAMQLLISQDAAFTVRGAPGPGMVPVRYHPFASEAEASAYALADNRLNEIAQWDDELLSGVLQELQGAEFDLGLLGWTGDELADLLPGAPEAVPEAAEPQEGEDADDQIPEVREAQARLGEVYQIGRHTLTVGDCIAGMRAMPDASVDAIVTDPPYGISFMGKAWDNAVPGDDWARECLRVLKPGGHLIAFAANRTQHRTMTAVEDAGFEIRDCIYWLTYSGFPKNLDVSKAIDAAAGAEREIVSRSENGIAGGTGKHAGQVNAYGFGASFAITAPATDAVRQWSGWGTALKPAVEPAVLARKPLDGTVAENVLKHGTGAINIDGCRIAPGDKAWPGPDDEVKGYQNGPGGNTFTVASGPDGTRSSPWEASRLGRWPANVYHVAKPARSEREEGCEELESKTGAQAVNRQEGSAGMNNPRADAGRTASDVKNFHPTVKPIKLMRWLVRLVTPPGGTVLEPFGGSGTTLIAAEREGARCVAFELDPAYADIIIARVRSAVNGPTR